MDNQINQYDAYVIAGDTEEDKLFLETMKSNLESTAFNLRLYIKSRDGPGDFDHQKESEIIMNSCEKIIVVLSRDFTQNEQCMYLLRVAISKSPGFHLRHIIPIHREECLAPSCIRFLTANDYTKEDIRTWFWPRVAACFKKNVINIRTAKKNLPAVVCLPDIIVDSFSSEKQQEWRNN